MSVFCWVIQDHFLFKLINIKIMPNQNPHFLPQENVEIREIENYQPHWLAKTFLSTTYCCENALCGCCCSKTKCECKNPEFSFYRKDYHQKIGNATASGSSGNWDGGLSGEVDFTLFRNTGNNKDLKVGSFSAGADITRTGVILRTGANLVNAKTNGVEFKIGLNLDTGASLFSSNGLEFSFLGFGLSVGKKLEISTIAGAISVDADENCVIQ